MDNNNKKLKGKELKEAEEQFIKQINEDFAEKANEQKLAGEKLKCPRCGNFVDNSKATCSNCGYNGYYPMSKEQIKKARIFLSIICIIIFIVILVINN